MTRPCLSMSRRLVSRGFNSASLLLIGTFCLVGCRGLPWSSPDEPPRVSARIDPSLVLGELQIDDGSRVELAGLQLSPPSAESDWLAGTQVVAIVNGEPLFASEVLQRQSQSLAAAREQISGPRYRVLQEDLLRKQLKGFVDRRLMAQAMMSGLEADRVEFLDKQLDTIFTKQELPQLLAGRNLQSIVELKRKLTEEGTSLEVLKEDFQQQQLAMEYLRQTANPRTSFSPAEMMAWYREHLDEFQTKPRVRWRQILVSVAQHADRDAALRVIESLRGRLSAGEEFALLARELSDGPAASDGGRWDWTDRESFQDKRIAEALFRLPVGTPSRIFEGMGFFQLVVATEREDGGAARFETVQPQIEKRLGEENRAQEMERVVGELQTSAQVTTVFDRPGRPFLRGVGKSIPTTNTGSPAQPQPSADGLAPERGPAKKEIPPERG